jgi:GNAT superfamily N-acetyltransferase
MGAGMLVVRRADPRDAAEIRRIAATLKYEPPGSDKGFLVHVRSEREYWGILEISRHSFVAEEEGAVIGYLLIHTIPELERLAAGALGPDNVVRYVLGLGDRSVVYADQIGVALDARSRGTGQVLAEAMAREHPGAHFLAAIMHRPSRNEKSLRLALRNGWTLRTEVADGGFVWGIYGKVG